ALPLADLVLTIDPAIVCKASSAPVALDPVTVAQSSSVTTWPTDDAVTDLPPPGARTSTVTESNCRFSRGSNAAASRDLEAVRAIDRPDGRSDVLHLEPNIQFISLSPSYGPLRGCRGRKRQPNR